MPSWTDCFSSVVVGRVSHRWRNSRYSWDEELGVDARSIITGARTFGEALVYSYSYLNHHTGGARAAFNLCGAAKIQQDECVLVDYGCGPATALMGLAELHFQATQDPLHVNYLGFETPDNPTLEIARELFECLKERGLLTAESACHFARFGEQPPWPPASQNATIFFALCYVLAHPYYRRPLRNVGRNPPPDPVNEVAEIIQACRAHYAREINLAYTNARWHPETYVHDAWIRLARILNLPVNIRKPTYIYDVFGSERINGKGSVLDWKNQQFRFRAGIATGEAHCDHQVFP